MPPDTAQLERRLAELAASFTASLPGQLQQVELHLQQLAACGEHEQRACLGDIERLAHGLAGSAAIYGFRPLSDRARELEIAARALLEDSSGSALHLQSLQLALREALP